MLFWICVCLLLSGQCLPVVSFCLSRHSHCCSAFSHPPGTIAVGDTAHLRRVTFPRRLAFQCLLLLIWREFLGLLTSCRVSSRHFSRVVSYVASRLPHCGTRFTLVSQPYPSLYCCFSGNTQRFIALLPCANCSALWTSLSCICTFLPPFFTHGGFPCFPPVGYS